MEKHPCTFKKREAQTFNYYRSISYHHYLISTTVWLYYLFFKPIARFVARPRKIPVRKTRPVALINITRKNFRAGEVTTCCTSCCISSGGCASASSALRNISMRRSSFSRQSDSKEFGVSRNRVRKQPSSAISQVVSNDYDLLQPTLLTSSIAASDLGTITQQIDRARRLKYGINMYVCLCLGYQRGHL